MKIRTATVALVLCAAAGAHAQSFNVDIGQPGSAPPETYAGAGRAGHWISVPALNGVNYFNMVDVEGNVTPARVIQIGGTDPQNVNDPEVTGDDALLMNDCIVTHTAVENCLFFYDMEPGEYEVILYARVPAQDDIFSLTTVDQEPGVPEYLVGGPWPGQHEEGVTYSRHTATVAADGPGVGRLWMHSAVPSGGDFTIGAAINGVQIRKLVPVPGDLDGDCDVDTTDLNILLSGFGCVGAGCAGDIDGDGDTDTTDLNILLSAFGTGC